MKLATLGVVLALSIPYLATGQTVPRNIHAPVFPRKQGLQQINYPPRAAATSQKAMPPNVIPATCPAAGAVCGYVPVPLDHRHPKGPTIQIYFEMYPHTNPGPAQSAILVNFGGPAFTTTGNRDFAQFLFAANLDVHDLLLIDDRGSGLSGAIDCEELQHGTAPFAQAEADCAAQLGDAASRYGSGDVAEDMDAVRAALGYDQVDYFGASYGGADAAAYATRFGKHLRSVILDAPVGTPADDPFVKLQFRVHSDPRMVRLVCLRSPICSADHPEPKSDLEQLIHAVQAHPVEGDSHDASGNPVHVRIDEDALLNFVVTYPSGIFTSTGEIPAATAALHQGDTAPLIRLGAEGFFTLVADSGDQTFYSAGDFHGRVCADSKEPWDWNEPVSRRMKDYTEAVADLSRDYFAPFSKSAPTGILFSIPAQQCLWWQKPTPSSPIAPRDAVYPNVPTLVLVGDIDNRVPLEEVTEVAALFPHSTLVTVAEAGHTTVDFFNCPQKLVSRFLENLHPGDTSCASTPETVWPAVGRFPLLAKHARPAEVDPSGSNQVESDERKTVTVAVATAIDALQRSIIGSGDGVGLRAGTFHTNYDSTWTTKLTGCAFATDVIVSGTVLWGAGSDNSIVADLIVSGPGTAGGTLHVVGFWLNPGPVGNFRVSGTLGGKQVAVLVPEA